MSKKAAAAEIQRLVNAGQTPQEVVAQHPELAHGLEVLIPKQAKPRGSGPTHTKVNVGLVL